MLYMKRKSPNIILWDTQLGYPCNLVFLKRKQNMAHFATNRTHCSEPLAAKLSSKATYYPRKNKNERKGKQKQSGWNFHLLISHVYKESHD